MARKFKINDTVCDSRYGEGKVIGVKDTKISVYNLIVLFKKKNIRHNFTEDGVRQGFDKPTLSLIGEEHGNNNVC